MARATQFGHVRRQTIYGHFHFAMFEIISRNAAEAAAHIEALIDLARAARNADVDGLLADFLRPWSRGVWAARMPAWRKCAMESRLPRAGNRHFIPFFATASGRGGSGSGRDEAALATIDGALRR